MDSGAPEHMVCDLSLLAESQQVMVATVKLTNGTTKSSTLKGRIVLANKQGKVMINNTYFIPGISLNILSRS